MKPSQKFSKINLFIHAFQNNFNAIHSNFSIARTIYKFYSIPASLLHRCHWWMDEWEDDTFGKILNFIFPVYDGSTFKHFLPTRSYTYIQGNSIFSSTISSKPWFCLKLYNTYNILILKECFFFEQLPLTAPILPIIRPNPRRKWISRANLLDIFTEPIRNAAKNKSCNICTLI